MKAAEKQRLQKRMTELRADRDRLAELLELKDRQLAECRAEATHYEHRASIQQLNTRMWERAIVYCTPGVTNLYFWKAKLYILTIFGSHQNSKQIYLLKCKKMFGNYIY
jgi:hypothetical protein